jgi:broad specificity phosphatase PhoE
MVAVVFETHSTSEDNERGIATGWLGGTLSAAGREQARELGARRRDDGLDAIYVSDLNRAVETARIAFGDDVAVLLDWRLRECDYGSWNGMPRARLDAERVAHVDDPWPGGESWRQAATRVDSFLDELAEARSGLRVLLIGHVATRWALEHRVLGTPLEELAAEEFDWQPGWEYELVKKRAWCPRRLVDRASRSRRSTRRRSDLRGSRRNT